MKPHLRTECCLAAAWLTTGCGAGNQPSRWEGEFVVATSSEELELCPGTLQFWDDVQRETYRAWYGEEPGEDLVLEIELRSEPDAKPGPGVKRGLAFPYVGWAWAREQDVVLHELTHLTIGGRDGRSASSALTEGLAESFGPSNRIEQWSARPTDVGAFFFEPRLMPGLYTPAAQFIRVLNDEYGLATIRDAYQAAAGAQTAEEIESSMVEIFGDGLYDTFDVFDTTYGSPLQPWECGGAVLPPTELPLTLERLQGCEGEGTLGTFLEGDDEWYPFRMSTVDIDETTPIEVDPTDNAVVYIERCISSFEDADSESAVVIIDHPNLTVYPFTLQPGRHILTVQPKDPALPYSARIVPTDS